MRISFAAATFLASVGYVNAQKKCAQKSNENPTAGILAVRYPNASSIVPVGTPYNIVWDKTDGISEISIELCIGLSSNCVDSLCVANGVVNTGSYAWTPPTYLVPGIGATGYGLKIIAAGGDFQYSTQFGIANTNVQSSSPEPPKHKKTAVPVSEASDGQPQAPTGSITGTVTRTKEHKTGKKTYVETAYIVSTGASSVTETKTKSKKEKETATTGLPRETIPPVIIHHKPSSGILPISANATHPVHKPKTKTMIYTGIGSSKNLTTIVKPTAHKLNHSSMAPVTSVQIATASATSLPPSTTAAKTPKASTSGAAQKVLAGGMLAGLGAVAALVL